MGSDTVLVEAVSTKLKAKSWQVGNSCQILPFSQPGLLPRKQATMRSGLSTWTKAYPSFAILPGHFKQCTRSRRQQVGHASTEHSVPLETLGSDDNRLLDGPIVF